MFNAEFYFHGFYEAYRFQETLNFPRFTFISIAVFSSILSIFTLITMKTSKKVRRSYQFIISLHIIISTLAGILIPLSNLNGIANYSVIFMDKWCTSPHLPYLVFGALAFAYMAVLVTCFHSFVLNVIWSTNYRFPLPYLWRFPAASVINVVFFVYDVFSSMIYFVALYLGSIVESEDVMLQVVEYDSRMEAILKEKSVAVIIVTWGFVALIVVVSIGLAMFLLATVGLIFLNYKVFHNRRNWTSQAVQKQQKMILFMETCNLAMTIACYVPPCVILVLSLFLRVLPKRAEKLPLMLFVYLPLQLLPILDCLLHIYAIRAHRLSAIKLIGCVFPSTESSVVVVERSQRSTT